MSDLQRTNRSRLVTFRLGEIAPYLEKDPRTLRRWCEMKLVPGARRTRGGHWRIRGIDRASVLRAIRGKVMLTTGGLDDRRLDGRHKARRRKENAYPTGLGMMGWRENFTPRQAWAKLPADVVAFSSAHRSGSSHDSQTGWRNMRHKSDRARALADAVAWLREERDDLTNPWSRRYDDYDQQVRLEALIADIGPEKACAVFKDNDAWGYTGKAPRVTVALLSQIMGISQRTFHRWFPGWRRVFFNETAEDLEYGIVGKDDEQSGGAVWVEPIDPAAPRPGEDMVWD